MEVWSGYPDGSPKTIRHYGAVPYDEDPNRSMYWPSYETTTQCKPVVYDGEYGATLVIDPNAINIRGSLTQFIDDVDTWSFSINQYSQEGVGGWNTRLRIPLDPAMLRAGANSFTIKGHMDQYDCGWVACCPRSANLGTLFDIYYDLPDPNAAPSPSPSSTNPSDDGSGGSGGGSGDPNGSPSPGASQSPQPSPSSSPSSEPSPIGLNADEAFSPNGDGAKDAANVEVTAPAEWTLEVVGQGRFLTGSGNKNFDWDGKLNGVILPDGKYTLRLKAGAQEKTADVAIDTTPPIFTLKINDVEFPDIVDDQLPEIKIILTEDLSGYDGPKSLKDILFSRRKDGRTPKISRDAVKASSNNTVLTYNIPQTDDSILYAGDQSIEVEVVDKAGNVARKQRAFAVGAHTLWAGLPGWNTTATAYKLLQTVENEPPRIKELRADPNYRITVMDPDPVFGGEIPQHEANPIAEEGESPRIFADPRKIPLLGLFFAVNKVTGDSVYVHYNEEFQTLSAAIRRGKPRTFRIGTQVNPLGDFVVIGDVEINNETYDHIGPERGHTEIGPNSLAWGLALLQASQFRSSELELWRPLGQDGNASNEKYYLVFKYKGNLYNFILKSDRKSGPYFVRTAFGAARDPGDTKWRPLVYQWSYVAQKVAEFYAGTPANLKKYLTTTKKVSVNFDVTSKKPEFPHWALGNISDDQVKPYSVNMPSHQADADVRRQIPEINKKLVPGR